MQDELDRIKQRKLEELQRQYNGQAAQQADEEQQIRQQLNAMEGFVKPKLSKEALQRYGNIKAAHPDKAAQLLVVLTRLLQTGKVASLNDEQLKSILQKMSEPESGSRTIRK